MAVEAEILLYRVRVCLFVCLFLAQQPPVG